MARVLDTRMHVRVSAGMPEHPKVEILSDNAFRCLIEAWCLCRRTGNDGRIPVKVWTGRWSAKARREVLAAGLAHADGDAVEMHDWLDHQPSAAELDDKRRARADAGRKGGKRSGETRRGAKPAGSNETTNHEAKQEAIASHEHGYEKVTSAENYAEPSMQNAASNSTATSTVSDSVETTGPANTSEEPEANASRLLAPELKQTRSENEPDVDGDIESGYVGGKRYVANARDFRDDPPPKFHRGHEAGYVTGCPDCAATCDARETWLLGLLAATEPLRACPRHPGGTESPCRDCADARRTHDRWQADRDHAAEERRRTAAAIQSAAAHRAAEDRARAIAACPLGCAELDGYIDDGAGSRALCDHRPPITNRPSLRAQFEAHKRGEQAKRADAAEEPDHA